jgi:hypothetical protein
MRELNINNKNMISEAPIPMISQRSFFEDLKVFNEYCNDFYNINYGIYPIASSEQIEAAIGEYLTEPHSYDIQFDSMDREKVREILEPGYSWAGVSGGVVLGPAIEFTVCEE